MFEVKGSGRFKEGLADMAGGVNKGGDDLNHPALEQLPGLAYCINDTPRWREYLFCSLSLDRQFCILVLVSMSVGSRMHSIVRRLICSTFVKHSHVEEYWSN